MLHDLLHHWIGTWLGWVESSGYPGVIVLMAMESSIVPIPSEIVIPPAAYWAAQGRYSFTGVVLAGTLGVVQLPANAAEAREIKLPRSHVEAVNFTNVTFAVSIVRGRSSFVTLTVPKPKGATTGTCWNWYGLSRRCWPARRWPRRPRTRC